MRKSTLFNLAFNLQIYKGHTLSFAFKRAAKKDTVSCFFSLGLTLSINVNAYIENL